MLTVFKEIFTWWNHQTFGTRLQTIFWKISCKDSSGNKYYQNKDGKRWVIYMEKWKHRKYLMNGIRGCITQIIN